MQRWRYFIWSWWNMDDLILAYNSKFLCSNLHLSVAKATILSPNLRLFRLSDVCSVTFWQKFCSFQWDFWCLGDFLILTTLISGNYFWQPCLTLQDCASNIFKILWNIWGYFEGKSTLIISFSGAILKSLGAFLSSLYILQTSKFFQKFCEKGTCPC